MTLIYSLLLGAAASAAPLRVLLDAGHGGRDQGAVVGHVRESDVTLDVALKLRRLLAADPAFAARLTRDVDQRVALASRTRLADDWNADLFVSIHVNSSPDPRAHGAEFYFQNQLAADEESAFLAHREDELERGEVRPGAPAPPRAARGLGPEMTAIVTDLLDADRVFRSSRLTKALKEAWAGSRKSTADSVRQAPFFVLSQITTPSALVELGFLTNDDDRRRLTTPAARDVMAQDLYRGLRRYLLSLSSARRLD